jgi:hypothetical protein
MLNPLVPREEITVTDNGKTVYDYGFKIYADTDIIAYATADGAEPNDSTDSVVISAVTGVGEASGGTITIPAMDANTLLTIVSNIPTDRDVSYVTNGDFIPETVDNDFDKTLSIVKQIDATRRGLKFADSAQGVEDFHMNTPEAEKFLRVNPSADAIIYTEFPTTVGSVTSVTGAAPGIVTGTASDPIINSLASVTGDRVDGSTPSTPVINAIILMSEENGSSLINAYYVDAIGTDRIMPDSLANLDGVICMFTVDSTRDNDSSCTLRITDVLASAYPLVTSLGDAFTGGELAGTVICRFDNSSGGRWLVIYASGSPVVAESVKVSSLDKSTTDDFAENVDVRVAKAMGYLNGDTETVLFSIGIDVGSVVFNDDDLTTITLTDAMDSLNYVVVCNAMDGTSTRECGAKILTSSTFELHHGDFAAEDSIHFVVYGILA